MLVFVRPIAFEIDPYKSFVYILYHLNADVSRSRQKRKGTQKMEIMSVKEVFDMVPQAFNPDAAKGLDAVFQFDITGEDGGIWHVVVKDGACRVQQGKAAFPKVTLTMASETWLGMVNRQINGVQAFMTGKLKLNGDMLLAQRIPDLFKF